MSYWDQCDTVTFFYVLLRSVWHSLLPSFVLARSVWHSLLPSFMSSLLPSVLLWSLWHSLLHSIISQVCCLVSRLRSVCQSVTFIYVLQGSVRHSLLPSFMSYSDQCDTICCLLLCITEISVTHLLPFLMCYRDDTSFMSFWDQYATVCYLHLSYKDQCDTVCYLHLS